MSEAGQHVTGVLSGLIDALKTNPSCLAAITLAIVFAILTYLSLRDFQAQQSEREMALIQRCYPVTGGH